jgi:ABC-type nitrate/sulfonate/bicarbonate transport system ATPase subunit
MAEAVTLTDVGKSFPGRGVDTPVLADIDLTIAEGEFVVLLGASGCGKSTLLRLIAGLERPTAGTVRLGAAAVSDVDPRCAIVFQEPRLLPWRTVAANVALGTRRSRGRTSPEAMLHQVGLAGAERSYPHQLSGGMAQRVALARALIGHPEVLLLDEPFASLDALTRLKMQDLLVETCRQPRPTVVMVTHDVDEALRLADRIVLLGSRGDCAATILASFVPWSRPGDRADAAAISRLRNEILGHFGLSTAA